MGFPKDEFKRFRTISRKLQVAMHDAIMTYVLAEGAVYIKTLSGRLARNSSLSAVRASGFVAQDISKNWADKKAG